jgi:hypothetical protein
MPSGSARHLPPISPIAQPSLSSFTSRFARQKADSPSRYNLGTPGFLPSKVSRIRASLYLGHVRPTRCLKLEPEFRRSWRWPAVCCQSGMSAIVYKVNRKSGDYIKAAVIPSNHSEESHFGLVDGVIAGFLLLCACGLVCLLVLH